MIRRGLIAGTVFVMLLAGQGVGATEAPTEQDDQRSGPAPGALHSPRPEDSSAEALAYWTDERLAAADTRDIAVIGEDGAAEPRGPGVPPIAVEVPRPYTDKPDRMVGVVFGTDSIGDFRCSGAVVTAPNRSVVWTTGHCVYNYDTGEWASRVVFIPAFSSTNPGDRPYGTWSAPTLWSSREWIDYGNYEADIGALVLRRLGGRRIEARVGAHRIAFNRPVTGVFRPYGYPSEAPFDGFDQWACASPITGRDYDDGVAPMTLRVNCDLNPGSSGGPWLRAIDAQGVGTISSMTSYSYNDTPNDLYGPYLGAIARSVYLLAGRER